MQTHTIDHVHFGIQDKQVVAYCLRCKRSVYLATINFNTKCPSCSNRALRLVYTDKDDVLKLGNYIQRLVPMKAEVEFLQLIDES